MCNIQFGPLAVRRAQAHQCGQDAQDVQYCSAESSADKKEAECHDTARDSRDQKHDEPIGRPGQRTHRGHQFDVSAAHRPQREHRQVYGHRKAQAKPRAGESGKAKEESVEGKSGADSGHNQPVWDPPKPEIVHGGDQDQHR